VFRETLQKQRRIIDRSETILRERGLNLATVPTARLYPDMYPLTEQARGVPQIAMVVLSRLSGISAPIQSIDSTAQDIDFDDYRAWLQTALDWIEELPREAFEGAEEREIIFPLRRVDCRFSGRSFLFSFGLPNLFFHASIFYAILRHIGVPLGKSDFVLPRFVGEPIVVE
jgi:hypothetical protein